MYNAGMMADLRRRLDAVVWGDALARHGVAGRWAATILRYLYAIVRDVTQGQLTLRSMGLVYTTLLSIVPLLAFSVSLLSGFGIEEQLEPQLAAFLEPLGEQGRIYTEKIMNYVSNVNFGVLGSIGLAIFLYTAISMVQKIEESFNYVWYVTESRSFARRFTEYSLVLTFGPLLMFIAVGIMTTLQSDEIVQYLVDMELVAPFIVFLSKLTPYLIITTVFTALYMFMPNTKVKFGAALVGGITGGILWVTASTIFTAFIVGSENRDKVYAGFAVTIAALIWLYLNWLILLIGSQVAFYVQNPEYLRHGRREPRLSNSMRERLALNIMYLVGREFRTPAAGMDVHALSDELKIPSLTLGPILDALQNAGLLACLDNENLQPGREMSRITLNEIMAVVRAQGETGSHHSPDWTPVVDSVGRTVDDSVNSALGERTLSQLLDASGESGAGDGHLADEH
jgi:membrane protein